MSKKDELYTILDISKTSTDDEIKKAYKKAALKHHPDRNPNNPNATSKFQEVGKAFATLGDPDKRKHYDQFGIIDGEDNVGMSAGVNPFDIFQSMFNGGGGGGMGGFPGMSSFQGMNINTHQKQQSQKSPDKKITLNLSLIDVYSGKNIGIDLDKTICCDKCEGTGALSKEFIQNCKTCNGQGKIIKMVQIGPMIQQSIQHCGNCKGKGKMIDPSKYCNKCNGNKLMKIKKHLDCYVRPGSIPGTTITFKNESDWIPDCSDCGDLIISVNCKNEENGFRREGNNLIMKKSISLLEALTKTIFYFKHLDGRVIRIKHNEIIKPNQKMIVEEEGMPSLNNMNNGDLLINFDIVFPDSLEEERSKYLVKILPIPKKQVWDLQLESTIENNITDKQMTDYNDKQSSNSKFKPQNINEINEEDLFNEQEDNELPNMKGQKVECATQ